MLEFFVWKLTQLSKKLKKAIFPIFLSLPNLYAYVNYKWLFMGFFILLKRPNE